MSSYCAVESLGVFLTNSQHQPLKVTGQLALDAVLNGHLCNLLVCIEN